MTPPQMYDARWAADYERLANAGIPGRSGIYRLCHASLLPLPDDAHILVVGCGTGVELLSLAAAFPKWTFDAIEPATPMLDFCRAQIEQAANGGRIVLHPCTLEDFAPTREFDAATSILVSQHIASHLDASRFFLSLYALLRPGGRLFTADIHIPAGQDRITLLELWERQALISGAPAEATTYLRKRLECDFRPREEAEVLQLLSMAGFTDVMKLFSSLIYGAWSARK